MLKFLHKKYYPRLDFEQNCKHKRKGQLAMSCRKRRDGTIIGDWICRNYCNHNISFGTDRRGNWIKCKYLKEAID